MIPRHPHTPHWPGSLSVHRDDKNHADPSYFVGKQVVITEKLDGGITRFSQGLVYARASSAPTAEPWFSYVKSRTLPKLHHVPPHLLVIGEDCYAVHSVEYDLLPDSFFLFHILDREISNINSERTQNDQFWSWTSIKEFAGVYGLHYVPELFIGVFDTLDDITKWFMDHITMPSTYGPTCEGFVMRVVSGFPYETYERNACKFVRANHIQTDEHWKTAWKPARIAPA